MKILITMIAWVIVSLCNYLSCFAQMAQHNIEERELKIGEQVPNIEFNHITNYNRGAAKLSDFKGKLVILDFWATWCVPCVRALPKLSDLQKKFANDIVILAVADDTEDKVAKLFAENVELKGNVLPIITKLNLRSYFPHRALPHEVWIDGEGKLMAITDEIEVNENNIKAYLDNSKLHLDIKKDVLAYYIDKPLFMGGLADYQIDPQTIEYNSILTAYQKDLRAASNYPTVIGNVAKVRATNTSIQTLYAMALAPVRSVADSNTLLNMTNRVIWEARDSLLQKRNPNRSNQKILPDSLRVFNYELIMPKKEWSNLPKYMLEDLNRYFGSRYGIEGLREKRKVKCWVLTATGDLNPLKSKGGKTEINIGRYNHQFNVVNSTLSGFLSNWVAFFVPSFPYPIVDGTNFNLPVDFNFQADPKKFEEVNAEFKKYGLEFKFTEKEIDMIIIRDRN